MKKSANTYIYSNYSQEISNDFLAVSDNTFRGKSDFIAMCSQIRYLFQEKLPIIYANIRV
ncbi:hypothetical protein [Flavobacterium wongokense]|uniref:hypothetical protein n=1 Tax=Flavobacterium wongokense TaxID=2910674 RepID=UPI001F40C6A3|nr:hypothetical protein [Flavobacterium sp. WG47]MCF6133510.1 hypothetical protein [Flavobacterium sp. WG47]